MISPEGRADELRLGFFRNASDAVKKSRESVEREYLQSFTRHTFTHVLQDRGFLRRRVSSNGRVRGCEKIRMSAKIRPGPQGWFSWRTLEPNLSPSNCGDPIAVNSWTYRYGRLPYL
jgi:hypothetical protein